MTEERPLFVRLPAAEAEKLDRAAHTMRLPKKDLVTALISRHLDVEGATPRRVVVDLGPDQLTVGHASVRPAEPPEVLSLAQLSELVQVPEEDLGAMAEAGELPGRRIAGEWRFSRSAVLAWLAGDR